MKQNEYLSVLTHTNPEVIKPFAEQIIPQMGDIEVLQNRTGLVMLPYTDSVEGAVFHLGEVFVSEAHIRLLPSGIEGYGMCLERDSAFAMAVAVLDAALTASISTDEILTFIKQQADIQKQADEDLLRKVNATRVEMETF